MVDGWSWLNPRFNVAVVVVGPLDKFPGFAQALAIGNVAGPEVELAVEVCLETSSPGASWMLPSLYCTPGTIDTRNGIRIAVGVTTGFRFAATWTTGSG